MEYTLKNYRTILSGLVIGLTVFGCSSTEMTDNMNKPEPPIADKIEKTLALDYPADKLEIIVASDGSTDQTDKIVKSLASRGVKLHRTEEHKGDTERDRAAAGLPAG